MEKVNGMVGEPDITIAALKIWTHGRQFPELTDDWDGNWLNISAMCTAQGAQVTVKGPILHLSDVSRLLEECEAMYETLDGSASLACMEPNLRVQLKATSRGGISVTVEITPDHLSQWHKFEFEMDQTYLPSIISECKNVLAHYRTRSGLDIAAKGQR